MQKSLFKRSNRINVSSLAAKSDLAILKAKVDKIDLNKLKSVSAD